MFNRPRYGYGTGYGSGYGYRAPTFGGGESLSSRSVIGTDFSQCSSPVFISRRNPHTSDARFVIVTRRLFIRLQLGRIRQRIINTNVLWLRRHSSSLTDCNMFGSQELHDLQGCTIRLLSFDVMYFEVVLDCLV